MPIYFKTTLVKPDIDIKKIDLEAILYYKMFGHMLDHPGVDISVKKNQL